MIRTATPEKNPNNPVILRSGFYFAFQNMAEVGSSLMDRRWFAVGERVRVRDEDEYDLKLSGDPLPDEVCGSPCTIIPVRSVQGLPVSGENMLPLVYVQLDDQRTFVVHQDNLDHLVMR